MFIESSKGGQYARWGLTDDVLWSWNPKLVIAHFSGYGQTGDPDYVSRGCYDPVCQAFSCLMHLNGFADREALPAREIPSDYLSGLTGFGMCLAGVMKDAGNGRRGKLRLGAVRACHPLPEPAADGLAGARYPRRASETTTT